MKRLHVILISVGASCLVMALLLYNYVFVSTTSDEGIIPFWAIEFLAIIAICGASAFLLQFKKPLIERLFTMLYSILLSIGVAGVALIISGIFGLFAVANMEVN